MIVPSRILLIGTAQNLGSHSTAPWFCGTGSISNRNNTLPRSISVWLQFVAYEAADSSLLSPELAAGIRRVKGVRRIGVRIGNWLTAEQSKRLLAAADRESVRGKRNYAMLAMLIGCGLWRGELLAFTR
jgi:site-specific recombinase XerC